MEVRCVGSGAGVGVEDIFVGEESGCMFGFVGRFLGVGSLESVRRGRVYCEWTEWIRHLVVCLAFGMRSQGEGCRREEDFECL